MSRVYHQRPCAISTVLLHSTEFKFALFPRFPGIITSSRFILDAALHIEKTYLALHFATSTQSFPRSLLSADTFLAAENRHRTQPCVVSADCPRQWQVDHSAQLSIMTIWISIRVHDVSEVSVRAGVRHSHSYAYTRKTLIYTLSSMSLSDERPLPISAHRKQI